MITKLLFDLDGTLTDPKEGICKSVQYALKELGIDEPDIDKLEPFIGPPLVNSFMEFYGMTKERAAEAVVKYRERFTDKGWAENIVYEGVPHMLKSLREAGYILAVASSKPTVFVERILTHFGLRDEFSVVVGSELDGKRINKDEVIGETLRQLFARQDIAEEYSDSRDSDENAEGHAFAKQADAGERDGEPSGTHSDKNTDTGTIRCDELLMIGDRKFDVEGAHALGIRCVGVTYGYAQPDELKDAQADFLVDSPDELLKLLLGLREKACAGFGDVGSEVQKSESDPDSADQNNAKGQSGKTPETKDPCRNKVQTKGSRQSDRASETKGGIQHA